MGKHVKKHPAHEKEQKGTHLLHLAGLESDQDLEIALRAKGNTVTAPQTLEQHLLRSAV